MLFAPSHLMSIMTLGINSGLVMDCGYTETLVLPVSFPRGQKQNVYCIGQCHQYRLFGLRFLSFKLENCKRSNIYICCVKL